MIAVAPRMVGASSTLGAADLAARVARLAEIRSTGLVRHASEQTEGGVEQSLPLSAALRPLVPGGCLRRGSTISVMSGGAPLAPTSSASSWSAPSRSVSLGPASSLASSASASSGLASSGSATRRPGAGSTSLLFTLLAEASAAGSWCAVVGLPRLGLVAAAEAGLALERLALVPTPGPEWASVVAALLDGVDIVVLATPGGISAQVASRLTARARQRGVVLVSVGRWPGADLVLEATGTTWHGLGQGRGRLRSRETEVVAHGRGAATRARRVHLRFPASASEHPTTLVRPLTSEPALVRPPASEQPDRPSVRPGVVALPAAAGSRLEDFSELDLAG